MAESMPVDVDCNGADQLACDLPVNHLEALEMDLPDEDDPCMFDPSCDPDNPVVIKFQDVSAAAFRIRTGIVRTPCEKSHMSKMTGIDIFFKKEYLQYSGSFKERGARNTLLCLSKEQKKNGVIAASAGNHALALAYHGSELGIPVYVVMPIIAPLMKVEMCKQHGATVLVKGEDIGESKRYAMKIGEQMGLVYINGYDHPQILSGQGTIGLEITEQVSDVDAIIVPVGGAGLIAGVATAIKALYPDIVIYGAEPARCASFARSIDAGKATKIQAKSTLADGLAVPLVGVNAFETARHLVDRIVAVEEEYIALAILRLVEMEKAVVEGAGACGLAAVLQGAVPELQGKRVVILLCGGNIDTTVLGRCIERGLAADGRLIRFAVVVSDRPGGIAELTGRLAAWGASIKDIFHERAWLKSDIFNVNVRCVCETRGTEHAESIRQQLEEVYEKIVWGAAAS